jgi:adenine-specific DNA glycosylase
VRRGDAVLLVRPKRGLLAGLWALPGGPGSGLARMVRLQTGIEVEVAPGAVGLRHAFSHRSWNMEVAAATACDGARPRGGARWVARAELPGLAMSTAMRKALRAAGIEA